MNVNEAARAFRAAEEHYHSAFQSHMGSQIQPLPDDRFWQLQEVFVREVIAFRFGYGRSNGIQQAAGELFRKPLANDFSGRGSGDVPRYSMPEAIQFARTWRDLTRRLYQPLFDVIENRGDDAYGDLLDALPLASREVVQKSLDHAFSSDGQLAEAVGAACPSCPQLAELILHGENYVAMALMEAAQEYFAIWCEDGK